MRKSEVIVRQVTPKGEPMMYFDIKEVDNELDLYTVPALNPFQNRGKAINKIHFYNETGIVYTNNSGWLTRKLYGNNPFYSLAFEGDIQRRIKVKFDKVEAFVVLSTKHDVWGNKAYELYVPMSYLDSLGYSVVKETTEYEYETHTRTEVYVGGERTINNHLFMIPLESTREQHFDKLKAVLMTQLAECETKDQLVQVVKKHLPVV